MKKRCLVFVCIMLMLMGVCGCNTNEPLLSDELSITVVDVSELLTTQEVWEASAIQVADIQKFDDGAVGFFAADNTAVVYVAAQPTDKATYDAMVLSFAETETLTQLPHLAEVAMWSEAQQNLLAYANDYAIDIRIEYPEPRPNDSLQAARHLAALLVERL